MYSPLSELLSDPTRAIFLVLAFVAAITVHEGNHALVATLLGDDTPRRAGRMSLNPMRHVDRLGLLMFVIAGFGWASTPVNPNKLRPDPRTGNAIVAAAGPVANLLLALPLALILRTLIAREGLLAVCTPVGELVSVAMTLTLLLFVFNLIPLPPLDGFTVLIGVLPRSIALQLRRYEQYGPGILLVVLLFLPMMHINVLGDMFRYAYNLFSATWGLPPPFRC